MTFSITAEVPRADTPTPGTPTGTTPPTPPATIPMTSANADSLITGTGNATPNAPLVTGGTTPAGDGLTTGFTATPFTQVQAGDNGGFGAGAVNTASLLNRQGNGDLSTSAIFRQSSQANVELFLAGSVGNQTLLPQQQTSFQVPKNIFRHTNPSERLVYQAVRPDGSPLPNWLQFDAQNLSFRGAPPTEARGALAIVIVIVIVIVAKAQLAALVNIPPRTEFTVELPPEAPSFPRGLSADLPSLELIALSQRPELREEAYQERVDRNNLYKEMIRLVPGLSVLGGLNYDSNSYLVNNLWAEAGVRATYNFVNLISGPIAIDAARKQIEVSKVRRFALSVAVLTQVNVSYQQYLRSVETLDLAQEISQVEAGIAKAVLDGADRRGEAVARRPRRRTPAGNPPTGAGPRSSPRAGW